MNEHATQLLLQIWNELTVIPQDEALTETTQLVLQEIEDYLEDLKLIKDGSLTPKGDRLLY